MLSRSPGAATEDEERRNFKANVFPGVMQPRSIQLWLSEKSRTQTEWVTHKVLNVSKFANRHKKKKNIISSHSPGGDA